MERSVIVDRISDSQLENLDSNPYYEPLSSLFTLYCSSSLSCVNEYMGSKTLIAAWLNASKEVDMVLG